MKLLPFISRDRAARNDDNREQPNTYVVGEIYNNPHVLSEIFPPLQPLREEIKKDKTTNDIISLTRDMLQSIVSNTFEEQKRSVDATTLSCLF